MLFNEPPTSCDKIPRTRALAPIPISQLPAPKWVPFGSNAPYVVFVTSFEQALVTPL